MSRRGDPCILSVTVRLRSAVAVLTRTPVALPCSAPGGEPRCRIQGAALVANFEIGPRGGTFGAGPRKRQCFAKASIGLHMPPANDTALLLVTTTLLPRDISSHVIVTRPGSEKIQRASVTATTRLPGHSPGCPQRGRCPEYWPQPFLPALRLRPDWSGSPLAGVWVYSH